MAEIERSVSYLQGSGCQCLFAFQNLAQVVATYSQESPLLASIHTSIFYTPTPTDTLTSGALALTLGEATVTERSTTVAGWGAPVTKFAEHGTQQVSFTLRLEEPGPAGQAFRLYVPVEAYSQVAEAAGDLNAGDAVLVAGKLKWTSWTDKSGQKRSTLCVLARLIKVLMPVAVMTGKP